MAAIAKKNAWDRICWGYSPRASGLARRATPRPAKLHQITRGSRIEAARRASRALVVIVSGVRAGRVRQRRPVRQRTPVIESAQPARWSTLVSSARSITWRVGDPREPGANTEAAHDDTIRRARRPRRGPRQDRLRADGADRGRARAQRPSEPRTVRGGRRCGRATRGPARAVQLRLRVSLARGGVRAGRGRARRPHVSRLG